LSEVFASTPLYRKHLRAKYSSASEFRLIDPDFEHYTVSGAFTVGQSADRRPALPVLERVPLFGNRLAIRDRWLGTFGAVELEYGIGLHS
jgi:hypothetical protein